MKREEMAKWELEAEKICADLERLKALHEHFELLRERKGHRLGEEAVFSQYFVEYSQTIRAPIVDMLTVWFAEEHWIFHMETEFKPDLFRQRAVDAFDETMKRLLTNEATYEATAEIMRDTARVMTLAERRRTRG